MYKENVVDRINDLEIEKRAFINGHYVQALDKEILHKVSPVDGRDLSGISSCKEEDLNLAVAVAKSAFESEVWSSKPPKEKKLILFELANLMEQNREELALLDTLETGRAFKNYYYDSIPKAIEALHYFSESVDKYYDHVAPSTPNTLATITREPLGVVGLITPWNDPMVVSIWKLAPALLMGNSVVIKPAEQSSFSIILLARLAKEAGIPDGVINVVTGLGNIVGKGLALHNDVSGIFFTGSSSVGKKILQYSGQSNMKKVGLECGGKSPFIISKNCKNISKAVSILAKNIFYNQGQICSAPSKVIVDNGIKNEVLDLLKKEMKAYIPSDPFDPTSEVGCVVSKEQKNIILNYIDEGVKEGAVKYSSSEAKNMHPESEYVLPTFFIEENPESKISREEIFGPVVVVIGSDSMKESIRIANQSSYGLAASIWSDDASETLWVSKQLQAGIVHVNSYGDDNNTVPFGGIKESGLGKDKSIFAFDDYSYLKTTWIYFDSPYDS